ncbi:elongation factor Ts [candidate division WWE3 bacterium]|nr:elongation factor Ts [candidate division WWE3 bacterium]
MATLDAKLIKKLRDLTGAGILDIKNALEQFAYDEEKTKAFLMEKGKERAAGKSERNAKDGLIFSYIHNGGKVGSMVYVACETDFVARTEAFQALCKEIAMQNASISYDNVEDLLNDDYIRDGSKKIKDLVSETIAKVGENIELKKAIRFKVGE